MVPATQTTSTGKRMSNEILMHTKEGCFNHTPNNMNKTPQIYAECISTVNALIATVQDLTQSGPVNANAHCSSQESAVSGGGNGMSGYLSNCGILIAP